MFGRETNHFNFMSNAWQTPDQPGGMVFVKDRPSWRTGLDRFL